jgi:hypothetical protein
MTALSAAVAFNSKAAYKSASPYKGGLDVITAQRPSSHDQTLENKIKFSSSLPRIPCIQRQSTVSESSKEAQDSEV